MLIALTILLAYILIVYFYVRTVQKSKGLSSVQKNNYIFLLISVPFLGILIYNLRPHRH
jgi:hypothetical protein